MRRLWIAIADGLHRWNSGLITHECQVMTQATEQEVIEYLWPHKRRVKARPCMPRIG